MLSKVALIGEETLLGREVKEVLETRVPESELEGYAASGEGNFSERDGETVFVRSLDATSFANGEVLVFAGSPEGAAKTYELALAADPHPTVIDCTGLLAGHPEARLVAPLLDEPKGREEWLYLLAHPAAAAITTAIVRLAKYKPIQSAVVHVFEPASERGKRGLTELHGQTTNLLAFKSLDKDVFDAQLAFNLLPRYGEEAPFALQDVETRVEREIATLLARRANGIAIPPPSVRVVQAPVFHGYSLSLWVQFEAEVRGSDLEEALASAQIEVRRTDEEVPTNAAVASQSGVQAGDIRVDPQNPRAAWFWLVADNLRVTADGVADLLRHLDRDSA